MMFISSLLIPSTSFRSFFHKNIDRIFTFTTNIINTFSAFIRLYNTLHPSHRPLPSTPLHSTRLHSTPYQSIPYPFLYSPLHTSPLTPHQSTPSLTLSRTCRRPYPKGCEDIGTWQAMFEMTSTFAVFTNAGLVFYTADYFG